jgi:hypothetical protein
MAPLKEWNEQRLSPRVPLVLRGRIAVPDDDLVLDCTVTDLSTGGAGLLYEAVAPRTSQIGILEIPNFGKFQGITVRSESLSRGFRFFDGQAERNDLNRNLAELISQGIAAGQNRRRHTRKQSDDVLTLQHPDGRCEDCVVIDISLEGVCLKTTCRAAPGKLLRVGDMFARVIRNLPEGIALSFVSFVDGRTGATSVTTFAGQSQANQAALVDKCK